MLQPLFPQDNTNPSGREQTTRASGDTEAALHHRHAARIEPVSEGLSYTPPIPHARHSAPEHHSTERNAAVELIRHKVEAAYGHEPSAAKEAIEAKAAYPRSKHQEFMYNLSMSGKPLAHIQSEWHAYYAKLPDDEKHEVWREFYEQNKQRPSAYAQAVAAQRQALPTVHVNYSQTPSHPKPQNSGELTRETAPTPRAVVSAALPPRSLPAFPQSHARRAATMRRKITARVREQAAKPEQIRRHARSLGFGLVTGGIVLVILLFGFFNQMIIAPFIQPSRNAAGSQIIIDGSNVQASDKNEIIIPKINVQIPVVYDANSTNEKVIQTALESGVVHYSTTPMPGQKGNAAIFGHSSNNILNKGNYKFAFVQLRKLEVGDIFYLTYNRQVYTYKVFQHQVVPPEQVSVMDAVNGKTATATLITCDPPGTTTSRLVVWGEQISPNPATATEPEVQPVTGMSTPTHLPSEGQSLWDRLIHWDF